MNTATRDRLNRRLDSLERHRPEAVPTVEIHIVEPGPDGPRPTGERWGPAPSGGFVQTRPADDAR